MPTDPTGEMPAPLTMSSLRETVIRKAYYMDSEIVRELFTEIEALRALKQPVLTRKDIYALGITNTYSVERFVQRLQALGINVEVIG